MVFGSKKRKMGKKIHLITRKKEVKDEKEQVKLGRCKKEASSCMHDEYIYLRGHSSPFITMFGMEFNDDLFFLGCKRTFFQIRPQMICPSEPATLAAPHQSTVLLHRIPISFSMFLHVLYQDGIFRHRPRPLFQALIDPFWRWSLSTLHHCSINTAAVPVAHHLGCSSTPSAPPLAAI